MHSFGSTRQLVSRLAIVHQRGGIPCGWCRRRVVALGRHGIHMKIRVLTSCAAGKHSSKVSKQRQVRMGCSVPCSDHRPHVVG